MLAGEVLRQAAARLPDKVAMISGPREITFAALDDAATCFAAGLIARGIAPGDRVALMGPNCIEYVIAHFGCARAGATIVNLIPAYAPAEVERILRETGARLLFAEDASAEKVQPLAAGLADLGTILRMGVDEPDWTSFLDVASADAALRELDPAAPLGMTFTGGTTGAPKGTLVSHACRYVSSWTTAIEHNVTEADTIGILTPLYHAMGSMVWMPTTVMLGATSVLLPGWDPDRFIEETAKHGITAVLMVPVQLQQILSDDHFDAAKLKSLTNIACGGAITPAGLVAEVAEKMPWAKFTNHYGQSETGPICVFKPHHPRDKADTIGLPALGVELEIIREDGTAAPTGETGEIVVRGPFLMDGYYNNAEETGLYFRSGDGRGWTGDLATRDEDGFIRLVGRSKDMIVSGGVNIYPREVELALESHDAVADCAVFGIPDEKWGEALVALVAARDGAEITEDTLIEFCGEKLARFKRPKIFQIVETIPKTPAGKVQKPKLREAFLAGKTL